MGRILATDWHRRNTDFNRKRVTWQEKWDGQYLTPRGITYDAGLPIQTLGAVFEDEIFSYASFAIALAITLATF